MSGPRGLVLMTLALRVPGTLVATRPSCAVPYIRGLAPCCDGLLPPETLMRCNDPDGGVAACGTVGASVGAGGDASAAGLSTESRSGGIGTSGAPPPPLLRSLLPPLLLLVLGGVGGPCICAAASCCESAPTVGSDGTPAGGKYAIGNVDSNAADALVAEEGYEDSSG